jgi:hypothetical protein
MYNKLSYRAILPLENLIVQQERLTWVQRRNLTNSTNPPSALPDPGIEEKQKVTSASICSFTIFLRSFLLSPLGDLAWTL